MKIFCVYLVFIFCSYKVLAQPSSHVNINFKLFDSKMMPIDLDLFCTEFQLFNNGHLENFCNNPNDPKENHFNSISQKFNLTVYTVYTDVTIDFIYRKDTMNVTFINSGYGAIFNIDTLVFKPGKYAIACASRIVDNHTLPNLPVLSIKNIDYYTAKADYYNYWLDLFLRPFFTMRGDPSNHWFRRLQKLYHIKPDDLTHKTAEQLK